MPELPEVQTIVNELQLIINKHITCIKIYTKKLRYLIPKNIIKLTKYQKIIRIYRIGKYIIFELKENISIIFHLGMSGRIRLFKLNKYKSMKHDHIIINLNNEDLIIFNDPRKFGFVDISQTLKLNKKKYLLKLGLDPFDKRLNTEYLLKKYQYSIVPIKQLLLNQTIISGIGNIYASEILYDAKISPFIPGCELDSFRIHKLLISIRRILKKAISLKGTSIKNFVLIDGTLGNFQTKFKVYNRENEKVAKFKIKRVVQYGRSTFFCPMLQKSKYNPNL